MKLSEAIRDGARFKDIHGQTLWVAHKDGPCGCVIGTSLFVMGETRVVLSNMYDLMKKHFPVSVQLPATCPVDGCDGNTTMYRLDPDVPGRAIEHLYEVHDWSKKAISEWVEVIENKLEAEAARQECRDLVKGIDPMTLAECGIV